ncbi:MAG: hypothetical protein KDC85_17680 [Saprospiraceae bacterium]|nr:hypothetical protein [Saprospiraceae bacterium]MCB9326602.1 hypothetical protein [Lewinellaceae bacterium]
MKYTKNNLKKLETLFGELDYTIRYEKGNFQSGYCIVEDRNMAVVNKFFDTEGRMNVLFEILSNIEVHEEKLTEASAKVLKDISKLAAKNEDEANETETNETETNEDEN